MQIPSTLSSALSPTLRFDSSQRTSARSAIRSNDRSTAASPSHVDRQNGQTEATNSSKANALLGQLDLQHRHDHSRRNDEIDHKKVRKELKHALKSTLKAFKHEMRDLLKELGANKEERKAIRETYKDFRHSIRDAIKFGRESNLEDLNNAVPQIPEAFEAFAGGLHNVVAEARDGGNLQTEAAPRGTRVPAASNLPPESDFSAQADVANSVPVRTPAGEPGIATEKPSETENEPVNAAAEKPAPLDQFFSSMESIFKEMLGSLMKAIESLLADPPRRDEGHHQHHDRHDRDDRNDRHGRHGGHRGVEAARGYNASSRLGFRFDRDG